MTDTPTELPEAAYVPPVAERPKNKWWLRLLWAVVIFFIVYAVLYVAAVTLMQRQSNGMAKQRLNVENMFSLGLGLSPFGLQLQAQDVNFSNATGESGKLGEVYVTTPLFSPFHTITKVKRIDYRNAELMVQAEEAVSDAAIAPAAQMKNNTKISNVAIWALNDGPDFAAEDALRVNLVTIDYRYRGHGHDASHPQEEASLTASPVTLPAGKLAPVETPLDSFSLRLTAEPALPRVPQDRAAMAEWQKAGGTLTVAPAEIDFMGMTVTLSGPLTLSPELKPQGNLKLVINGLDKAYDKLAAYNLLPPEQYELLGNMLRMTPGGVAPPFDFPIRILDGLVVAWNMPVWNFRTLPWEVDPNANEETVPAEKAAPQETTPVVPEAAPHNQDAPNAPAMGEASPNT